MLTVGLPTFRANEIAWLPMESLCNQVGIDFKWELIVCEELYYGIENEYCGRAFFESYGDRLSKVGCGDIRFIDLEDHVTLESKWKFITDSVNRDSQMLLLQASDNYSPCERLKSAYELMLSGADWIHSLKMYFYNCKTGKIILRDAENFTSSRGVNIGIRLNLIKNLPFRDRGRSVDSWLRDMAGRYKEKLREVCDDGKWETGINTDGFNRISLYRTPHYENPKPPYYKTDIKLDDILPSYVVNKLKKMI